MPGTCPGAPPSPCCWGEPILSSCHLPVSQWSFVIPVLWKKGNVFGEARGGVGRRWMPWETVVPVSLEEDQGLKLPSGRIALGGCSKQGRRQKVGSWWILRVCATDQTSLKQGEVGMHPSFPWVTIALSPHPPRVLAGRWTPLGGLLSHSSDFYFCFHQPWAERLWEETPHCVNYPWLVLGFIV